VLTGVGVHDGRGNMGIGFNPAEVVGRLQANMFGHITGVVNDVPWEQIAADIGTIGSEARPIVIQRGLGSLTEHYDQLRDLLKGMGFEVHVVDLQQHGLASIKSDAKQLAAAIDKISAAARAVGQDGKVTLVGHSKGGISSRWYLQRMNGIDNVAQLITLGTPHNGSAPMGHSLVARLAGKFSAYPGMRDITAHSPVVQGLNRDLQGFVDSAAITHPDFRMVSIAGDLGSGLFRGQDGLVSVGNARLRAAGANVHNLVVTDGGANHFGIAANIGVHEPTMHLFAPLAAGGEAPSQVAVTNAVNGIRNLRGGVAA